MHPILRSYLPLVDFLAAALGSNTEIVLHDLSNPDKSVIAIGNGQISGRELGAPATDLALKLLESESLQDVPYLAGYEGESMHGHRLRSSTLLIRSEEGELIGLLCINSDYHAFLKTFDEMSGLISAMGLRPESGLREGLHQDVEKLVRTEIARLCPGTPELAKELPQREKRELVEELVEQGVFQVKGAVGHVAECLGISVPTVYRYLQNTRKE